MAPVGLGRFDGYVIVLLMMQPYRTPGRSLAAAAVRGLTLRVQMRPGPPDEDDPLKSSIVVDGPAEDSDGDGDMMLDDMEFGAGLPDADVSPQMDRLNANTVNRTGYIDNNFPIAQQPAADGSAGGIPPDISGMLAGLSTGAAPGPQDPRKRAVPGIMAGLGLR